MEAENKTDTFFNEKWPVLPVFLIMFLSGIYVFLYVYVNLQRYSVFSIEHFSYWWIIFLFSNAYFIAIIFGLLFSLCGFIFIFKLNKPEHTAIKKILTISWSILSAFVLVTLCGYILILSISSIDHVDSITHKQYVYHLAFQNNNDAGFAYYLFECDRSTFQCTLFDSFFPYGVIIGVDETNLSQLDITSDDILTITYRDRKFYEHPLSPK